MGCNGSSRRGTEASFNETGEVFNPQLFANPGQGGPAFPGFNFLYSSTDARVVLNALSEVTEVNVLSAPQLLVLDNRTARLSVGDQVPIPLRSSVSVVDPDAPIVNDIEYRDTGVILRITPRVNAGGLVSLDIAQEVSDVATNNSSNIDAPVIQQRTIQSSVAVQDGESVALAGLIRDSLGDGVTGIPVLSDIPVLGNLFKTTITQRRRTELLVLLTPGDRQPRSGPCGDGRAAPQAERRRSDDSRYRLRASSEYWAAMSFQAAKRALHDPVWQACVFCISDGRLTVSANTSTQEAVPDPVFLSHRGLHKRMPDTPAGVDVQTAWC